MSITSAELLTFIIAIGGFLGTIALLVLNLKVSGAVKAVELELANLRTEIAKEATAHYANVMNTMTTFIETLSRNFANREAADAKHEANIKRLDAIEMEVRNLSQRISDVS